jgi:hypothetical protein
VRTAASPGVTWEVRLAWGTRRLAAEVVSPARRVLRLGSAPGDDVDTGHAARLELELEADAGLRLRFSPGVEGLVSLQGDSPVALGGLVQRGLAREVGGAWQLRLQAGDAAELVVGQLSVHLRRARGRVQRLAFDGRHLVALLVALALLGGLLATGLSGVPSLRSMLPTRRSLQP